MALHEGDRAIDHIDESGTAFVANMRLSAKKATRATGRKPAAKKAADKASES